MKNNKILATVIYTVIIFTYNLCIFCLIKNHEGAFWCGYFFSMLALLMQYATMFLIWGKNRKMKDIFLGLPVLKDSIIYLIAQLAVGFICMIFRHINMVFAFLLQIIILAAFLVIAISAMFAKNVVTQIDDKVKDKRFYIKSMVIDLESMQNKIADSVLKKELGTLIEIVRYSDPMSNECLHDLEKKIQADVKELDILLQEEKSKEAKEKIANLNILMAERNKKCMLLK